MSTSLHPRRAPQPGAQPHLLDNPAWAALTGPHAHLAERHGRAARYPVDVSPFTALADPADPRAWADLAELVGPGVLTPVTGAAPVPPEGWERADAIPGVQLVATALETAPDPEAVQLGPADVPEMLGLVERTRPGPFLPRTIALGSYLGLRRQGRLVAMAGERLHLPGWTEISAVCTHPDHRGQGLATRLVRAVAAGIRARGETPFLHAAASNTHAIRLYESLGFTVRGAPRFLLLRSPAAEAAAQAETGAAAQAGAADRESRPPLHPSA